MSLQNVLLIMDKRWDEVSPRDFTEVLWFISNPTDTDTRNLAISWASNVFQETVKEAWRLTDEVKRLRR